ncbi:PREDICTED: nitrile-specifier protein 5 [Tarenaya hassleriana]|uniref:nitrile-specifier protein 5 n=1 Tax=Tarenaya hassleriana TaxID=28532 RepID=UPI00053C94CC|nr:PREDICTED: nitrile-specifier protein 5 [Tarenaya hassleriana]
MATPMKGNWVKLDQKGTGPGARSSHAIALVGDKVYAFGGEFAPRVPVDNHLYVFDLRTTTWSVAPATGDVPPPRIGVAMATVGGGPPHRSYHSIAADEENVYVFGGCGVDGRLNDLWAFNVVAQKWIQFPAPGEACKGRGGPGLGIVQGKIWVVYGFTGVEADDVHCFDPAHGKWKEVETEGEKPSPRSVFSTAVFGKQIVICGGEVDPSDLGHLGAGRFTGDVFGLDTETLKWTKWEDGVGSGDHPGPRGWCAFAAGKEGLLVY